MPKYHVDIPYVLHYCVEAESEHDAVEQAQMQEDPLPEYNEDVARVEEVTEEGRSMNKEKIGATSGLVAPGGESDPEQVLVFYTDHVVQHPDHQPTPRTIRLEFWRGYRVPNEANLTKNQAVELIGLLAKALGALS